MYKEMRKMFGEKHFSLTFFKQNISIIIVQQQHCNFSVIILDIKKGTVSQFNLSFRKI